MYIKEIVYKLIDEYSGSHYRFLFNYLDGGYEPYVFENTNKIAYRKTYGVEHLRREFRNIHSREIVQQKIMETCEKTIDYIKRNYVYVH